MARVRNTLGIGLGILGGIFAGAVIGLLYAPKRGEETRKLVKAKAIDASNQAKNVVSQVMNEATTAPSKNVKTSPPNPPLARNEVVNNRELPVSRPLEIQTEEAAHPRPQTSRRAKGQSTRQTTVSTEMTHEIKPKQNIAGDVVVDGGGKEIGKLEGVMLDTESGQIIYGVIAFNDAEKKDTLCAVPWPALKESGKNSWTLAIPTDNIDDMLTFSRENAPDQEEIERIEANYRRYGYTPKLAKRRRRRTATVRDRV